MVSTKDMMALEEHLAHMNAQRWTRPVWPEMVLKACVSKTFLGTHKMPSLEALRTVPTTTRKLFMAHDPEVLEEFLHMARYSKARRKKEAAQRRAGQA